jgi:alanine dehydrogenase
VEGAIEKSQPLRDALNVHHGKITNEAVAETFDLPYAPWDRASS